METARGKEKKSELILLSIICVLSANGTTIISSHVIITYDLVRSGLVAQSVEKRTIKSGSRAFDFRSGRAGFTISILGPTFGGKLFLVHHRINSLIHHLNFKGHKPHSSLLY